MSSGEAKIGQQAPDFEVDALVDGDFEKVKMSDFKGKYVVLFFYPLDFTFVCPTEIISFSDRAGEFKALNCEVVACSTDSHFSHLAWTQQSRKQGGLGDMQIPILADLNHEVCKKYGTLVPGDGIAYRALFIIDKEHNVRQITINDLPVGRSVDETLRLVKAFQFTDEYGEVCPANWTPGSDTIKTNPKEKLEYFEKADK